MRRSIGVAEKGTRPPRLPQLLDRKIYKTGQTRGADDDEIYQNRVSRTSTVLIPYPVWINYFTIDKANTFFENGFLVLISPGEYFSHQFPEDFLLQSGLVIGKNALVFYETRAHWIAHNPVTLGWQPAQSRLTPLGGQYVARIAATTSIADGDKIIRGFQTTSSKGAGIRVYEYARTDTIAQCRDQLEALFWLCHDATDVAATNGMTLEDTTRRMKLKLAECSAKGLLDFSRLKTARIINGNNQTICPLCLCKLSSQGFFSRMEQAEGREVLDLTITQLNLFQIEELRMGSFNHRPYNLGWGHHQAM